MAVSHRDQGNGKTRTAQGGGCSETDIDLHLLQRATEEDYAKYIVDLIIELEMLARRTGREDLADHLAEARIIAIDDAV